MISVVVEVVVVWVFLLDRGGVVVVVVFPRFDSTQVNEGINRDI